MPIAYPDVLSLKAEGQRFAYTEKDTMLYALGIGMGADPAVPDHGRLIPDFFLSQSSSI